MIDEVLKSCKFVVNNSKHVTINYNNIDNILDKFNNISLEHYFTKLNIPIMNEYIEDIVNLLLIYDSVCYSFWGEPK